MYKNISILNILQELEGVVSTQPSSHSENLQASPERMTLSGNYLAEIEQQIDKFATMVKINNSKQEEIRSLRDGVRMNDNPTLSPDETP
jgi:hypothetical protein